MPHQYQLIDYDLLELRFLSENQQNLKGYSNEQLEKNYMIFSQSRNILSQAAVKRYMICLKLFDNLNSNCILFTNLYNQKKPKQQNMFLSPKKITSQMRTYCLKANDYSSRKSQFPEMFASTTSINHEDEKPLKASFIAPTSPSESGHTSQSFQDGLKLQNRLLLQNESLTSLERQFTPIKATKSKKRKESCQNLLLEDFSVILNNDKELLNQTIKPNKSCLFSFNNVKVNNQTDNHFLAQKHLEKLLRESQYKLEASQNKNNDLQNQIRNLKQQLIKTQNQKKAASLKAQYYQTYARDKDFETKALYWRKYFEDLEKVQKKCNCLRQKRLN